MKYKNLESVFREHEQTDPKYHPDSEITFSNLGDFEDTDCMEIDRTYFISSKPDVKCCGKSDLYDLICKVLHGRIIYIIGMK